MTRTERSDLIQLARRRARVAKADAKTRAAELTAQVEEQLAAQFAYDDKRWSDARRRMEDAIRELNESIHAQLEAEGLPKRFHPSAQMMWLSRGETGDRDRRGELRRLAHTRIESELQHALADIDRAVVRVETDLLAVSTGQEAQQYLLGLPQPEALLPAGLANQVALELISGDN